MQTYEQRWIAYFKRNKKNRLEPAWATIVDLPDRVHRLWLKSLQQFHLGDGGGPACLIAWNAEEFRRTEAIREVVDLWFAEEKEHSRLLGGAVRRFGGEPIKGHWSFTCFCLVRKWLGVRSELRVLLLTEIVSTVYYSLMRKYGPDPVVRAVCDLILRDEAGHIAFHRDRMARSEDAHYGLRWEVWFRIVGLGAWTMLWVNHRAALRAMGASDGEFYLEVWRGMSGFIRRLRKDVMARRGAMMASAMTEVQGGGYGGSDGM